MTKYRKKNNNLLKKLGFFVGLCVPVVLVSCLFYKENKAPTLPSKQDLVYPGGDLSPTPSPVSIAAVKKILNTKKWVFPATLAACSALSNVGMLRLAKCSNTMLKHLWNMQYAASVMSPLTLRQPKSKQSLALITEQLKAKLSKSKCVKGVKVYTQALQQQFIESELVNYATAMVSSL